MFNNILCPIVKFTDSFCCLFKSNSNPSSEFFILVIVLFSSIIYFWFSISSLRFPFVHTLFSWLFPHSFYSLSIFKTFVLKSLSNISAITSFFRNNLFFFFYRTILSCFFLCLMILLLLLNTGHLNLKCSNSKSDYCPPPGLFFFIVCFRLSPCQRSALRINLNLIFS